MDIRKPESSPILFFCGPLGLGCACMGSGKDATGALWHVHPEVAQQASTSGARARGFCPLLCSRGPCPSKVLWLRTPLGVGGRVFENFNANGVCAIVIMGNFQAACASAIARPLQTKLTELNGASGTLVCSALSSRVQTQFTFVQVAAFIVCALAQGIAFWRWKRLSSDEKLKGWRLYGWFCGFSFLSSIVGCAAYASRFVSLKFYYSSIALAQGSNLTLADHQLVNEGFATVLRCTAAFYFLFPFEFCFTIVAKLFVLDRMQRFAVAKSQHQRRWFLAGRGLFAVVVVGISVGILGNIATAVHYSRSADYFSQAANAYAEGKPSVAESFALQANEKNANGDSSASVQRFSEVFVLLTVIAAFVIVVVNSLQIIASALRHLVAAQTRFVAATGVSGEHNRQLVAAASAQGDALHRKVLSTFVFIFGTVLVRSIFTIMYAFAQAFQNSSSNPCASSLTFCDPCLNVYSHILGWIIDTPMFQQVCISCPHILGARAGYELSCLTPLAAVRAHCVSSRAAGCAVGHVRRSRLGADGRQSVRSPHVRFFLFVVIGLRCLQSRIGRQHTPASRVRNRSNIQGALEWW